tara:strand:- start:12 stop:188 length:177 start_codon:yes stop_codon:yes gene_type:complete
MAKLPKEYRKYIGRYEKAPSFVKVALRKAGHGPTVVEPVVEEKKPAKKKKKTTKKSTK